jgi:hypothetical protein
MTNLNTLIERRQGELQIFLTEDDGSGNDWLEMSLKETYRQALEDLREGLPREKPETWTVSTMPVVSEENIAFNQAIQTVRAQIKELLAAIDTNSGDSTH